MQGKIRLISLCILIGLLSNATILGEALPLQPGTVILYTSQNARYTVSIKILGYPDSSPALCTFMDSGKIIWSKPIFETPSEVAISDNGQRIAMTNWGWYDEGASGSISFYNHQGDLLKEVPFRDPEKGFEGLKRIRVLAISPDGNYCAIGTDTKEDALFTVYDCRKGVMVWEKGYGFSEATEAKLSTNGEYILIATNDYYSQDMQFFLLDHQGLVLYQKTLPKNFSWDVPDYLRFKDNGIEFEILDYNLGKFLVEPLVDGGYQK